MMITDVRIRNFKALLDFEIHGLGNLVCLIGLNGAGKSTLLQAFDFVATSFDHLVRFRDWKNADILNCGQKSRRCFFELGLRMDDGQLLFWSGWFNVDKWRFVEESVRTQDGRNLLNVKDGQLTISDGEASVSDLKDSTYAGSIFSTRKFETCPRLKAVKDAIGDFRSLELLSPDELRKGSRKTETLSLGGKGLAGFLTWMETNHKKSDWINDIGKFYPRLLSVPQTKPGPGWFGFAVQENYAGTSVTDMKHVNDGLLRIMAILALKQSDRHTFFFDEIENGINQELIEKLVSTLASDFSNRQVFMTTHSALVLNYLSDESVRDSVFFLYRDDAGGVKGCKFFEISQMKDKLAYLNAGQVMADTNLLELSEELVSAGQGKVS